MTLAPACDSCECQWDGVDLTLKSYKVNETNVLLELLLKIASVCSLRGVSAFPGQCTNDWSQRERPPLVHNSFSSIERAVSCALMTIDKEEGVDAACAECIGPIVRCRLFVVESLRHRVGHQDGDLGVEISTRTRAMVRMLCSSLRLTASLPKFYQSWRLPHLLRRREGGVVLEPSWSSTNRTSNKSRWCWNAAPLLCRLTTTLTC